MNSNWLSEQAAYQSKRTLQRQRVKKRRWPLIAAWVYVGLLAGVMLWVTLEGR